MIKSLIRLRLYTNCLAWLSETEVFVNDKSLPYKSGKVLSAYTMQLSLSRIAEKPLDQIQINQIYQLRAGETI